MDIDIPMPDAYGDGGEEEAGGDVDQSFEDYMQDNSVDSGGDFDYTTFDYSCCAVDESESADIHHDRLAEAAHAFPQSDQARADTSSEHSRFEASQRDFNTSDVAERSSRPRTPRDSPLPPTRGLLDWHRPRNACRNRSFDRSDASQPRSNTPHPPSNDHPTETFHGVAPGEDHEASLSRIMSNGMDGRNGDSYHGTGNRNGGYKRRRDGKPQAGSVRLRMANAILQTKTTIIILPEAVATGADLSVDAMMTARATDTRSLRVRSCAGPS